ncbi:hypothetical protein [Sphingomonas oryzagri]|uniref:Rod shape-determining protein MreD n=1 Tax=Sphingomonas oryzagri TaxID=3042314 RepID=A0ABT6N2F4_9SPHN|nr:hypothetical protein [Sphingomonas oryzagri]MDH7639221.1 hypothetical protein [Sphingomonas oryzagri]
MPRQDYFDILIVIVSLFALFRGGPPERMCAIAFAVADLLTIAALPAQALRWHHEEPGVLVVDMALLAFLVWLSLRSSRWWPLVLAGMQLDTVVVHSVRLVAPDTLPIAYLNGTALWSYPMVLLLAAGTWRHRCRLSAYGEDRAWKRDAAGIGKRDQNRSTI